MTLPSADDLRTLFRDAAEKTTNATDARQPLQRLYRGRLLVLAGLDLASLTRRSDADERLTEAIGSPAVRGFLLQNLRSVPADEAGKDGGFTWQANLALLRDQLGVIGGWPDIEPVDGPFDHPVLWLAGEKSDYVRPEHEPAMRALFPRTRLATIKGAGHWVHSEQPESFVSALRVFLLG